MRSLSNEGTPSFLKPADPLRSEYPEWMPWARRSLRLCFAHKTIMIHRSFLGKSLTDSTFEHTRTTCMEASKAILREASLIQDSSDGPMLWIDQAFMVAAGITLSLDIFHRKTTDPEFEENRKHVEKAINMLSKFEHSMIAVRGVRLLTSMLAEQARLSAEKSMDNYKKRARQEEEATTPGGTAMAPAFVQVGDHGSFTNALKRQKFDVPKFLESFVGSDNNFSQSLRNGTSADMSTNFGSNDTVVPSSLNNNGDLVLGNGKLGNVLMQQNASDRLPPLGSVGSPNTMQNGMDTLGLPVDYGYEAFEQIFPPHTGISNSFLFEDLLNFEL